MSSEGTAIAPTSERYAQAKRLGSIIRPSDKQYQDSEDRPGSPYVVQDHLDVLERLGKIDKPQKQAGLQFRDDFARAGHEPLRAAPLELRSHGVQGFSHARLEAADRVHGAMRILGGYGSPAGSCAWHVLGMDWTPKQWAIERGVVHERAAHAVLMATLGVLVGYYGLENGTATQSRY
jgi:hypothetical protein